jgi:hypothetical protein
LFVKSAHNTLLEKNNANMRKRLKTMKIPYFDMGWTNY